MSVYLTAQQHANMPAVWVAPVDRSPRPYQGPKMKLFASLGRGRGEVLNSHREGLLEIRPKSS